MPNKFTVNDENQIFMETEDGKVWGIPTDPANSDYQAYLRWVENPNAPEFQTPWVEPQLTK